MSVEKRITATDANRRFSSLLRKVQNGERYIVTSHGEPVATLGPVSGTSTARLNARRKLLARLKRQEFTLIKPWTRDELYED